VCLLGSVVYDTQQSECFLLHTCSLQCLFLIMLIYHADMFQTRVAYSLYFTSMFGTKLHGQSMSPPTPNPTVHAETVHHYTQSYGEKWVYPKLCFSVFQLWL
jgi:hypothetical protein